MPFRVPEESDSSLLKWTHLPYGFNEPDWMCSTTICFLAAHCPFGVGKWPRATFSGCPQFVGVQDSLDSWASRIPYSQDSLQDPCVGALVQTWNKRTQITLAAYRPA